MGSQGLWTQLSHLPHGAASDLGSLFVTSQPAKGPTLEAPKWPTLPHHSGDFVLCHACSVPSPVEPGDEPGQPLFHERTFPKLPGTQRKHFVSNPKSKQSWSFHDHAPCSHLVLGRKKWVCGSPGPGRLRSLSSPSLAGHALSLEPTQASAWVDPPPTCSLCWKAPT